MAETPARTRPKHRSPSYPSIDLETALQRAQQLWTLAGRHSAPVSAVMSQFGYSPKSSGGLLALAALKKFGLIEDEGSRESRQVALTKLGHELLFYWSDRESDAWKSRARKAALTPAIHRELWDKYGPELPDDRVMSAYLVFERGFNESAAADLLEEFRSTLAYAGVADEVDTVSPDDEDSDGDEETLLTPPPKLDPTGSNAKPAIVNQEREQRTVQVPYSHTSWALLQGPFPMPENEWDALLETLAAMRRGLVKPADG